MFIQLISRLPWKGRAWADLFQRVRGAGEEGEEVWERHPREIKDLSATNAHVSGHAVHVIGHGAHDTGHGAHVGGHD